VVILAGRETGVVGEGNLDVTAHIIGVHGMKGVESGFEPVFRDNYVGVDER